MSGRIPRPHLCLLTETYHPLVGGGETQARTLAEGLVQHGWRVSILTRQVAPEHARQERIAGVDVHRLPPSGTRHLNKWGLLWTVQRALRRQRGRYDLLFVSGFRILGVPATGFARRFGKPCILKADSLGEMSGEFFTAGLARLGLDPRSLLVRPWLGARNVALRRADAYVAISSAVRDELIGHGIPAEAIHSIPNSVDTGRFMPLADDERAALRRRLQIPFRGRVAVYTGRLVSYKGLPRLVAAWREIHAKHPQAGLLLVGGGGLDIHNCEHELRQFVANHGLESTVQFTGNVDNVHEYLQASDVFVFPTENEAFGISLVEAMSCALPVVATTVGGVKDILEHETNGLAVASGDSRQLAEAVDRLLGDAGLGRRLGAAGRRTAEQRYSTAAVTRRYLTLFGEALAGRGGGATASGT